MSTTPSLYSRARNGTLIFLPVWTRLHRISLESVISVWSHPFLSCASSPLAPAHLINLSASVFCLFSSTAAPSPFPRPSHHSCGPLNLSDFPIRLLFIPSLNLAKNPVSMPALSSRFQIVNSSETDDNTSRNLSMESQDTLPEHIAMRFEPPSDLAINPLFEGDNVLARIAKEPAIYRLEITSGNVSLKPFTIKNCLVAEDFSSCCCKCRECRRGRGCRWGRGCNERWDSWVKWDSRGRNVVGVEEFSGVDDKMQNNKHTSLSSFSIKCRHEKSIAPKGMIQTHTRKDNFLWFKRHSEKGDILV